MTLQYEPNAFNQWSKKGKTPIVSFERDKDKSVNFFGALSYKRKKEIGFLSEGKKSIDFINFLETVRKEYQEEIEAKIKQHRHKLINQKEYEGLILIVLDQASIHRSRETKAYLKKNHGIFKLMSFPTYSPDLNPQEKVWKATRKDLAKVAGKYDWKCMLDRACRFLQARTFDYKFV